MDKMSCTSKVHCYVCGRDLNPFVEKGKAGLVIIFNLQSNTDIPSVKARKYKTRKAQKDNSLEMVINHQLNISEQTSSKFITKEGVCLQTILERKLKYKPFQNYMCQECTGQIHQYKELSEELNNLKCQIMHLYDAANPEVNHIIQSVTTGKKPLSSRKYVPNRNAKISKLFQNKIENVKYNHFGSIEGHTPNVNLKEPRSYSSMSNNDTIFGDGAENKNTGSSTKIDKHKNKHVVVSNIKGTETDSTTSNNTVVQSSPLSRRSSRIKNNATKTRKRKNYEDIINANIDRNGRSNLPQERECDEHLSNKQSCSIPNIDIESDVKEKGFDMKQWQQRQTSSVDKNTSHPCEICKFFL